MPLLTKTVSGSTDIFAHFISLNSAIGPENKTGHVSARHSEELSAKYGQELDAAVCLLDQTSTV